MKIEGQTSYIFNGVGKVTGIYGVLPNGEYGAALDLAHGFTRFELNDAAAFNRKLEEMNKSAVSV